MERYAARRLQPHFIAALFLEAFRLLGGTLRERETSRYEITYVPALVRQRDRLIGTGAPVLARYERVTFEKDRIHVANRPGPAEFLCPGHPLLDAVIDLVLERYRGLLKQGAVLVDPNAGPGAEPRVLYFLEHAIQDARANADGTRRIVSRRMQFVEVDAAGTVRDAGWAPYLDYRPATTDEVGALAGIVAQPWLKSDLESRVVAHTAIHLVATHLREVRDRREALVRKTAAAVHARLTAEISYWDNRANQLKDQELAGKVNARLNSAKARQRADELQGRLAKRMAELEQEKQLSAQPPVVVGGALVIPASLLTGRPATAVDEDGLTHDERGKVDEAAMAAVMAAETRLGRVPRAMPHENPGYDVESAIPGTGRLLFIEVKGKLLGKPTVTVSKTQILTALNKPDDFILAIVPVEPDTYNARDPVYIRRPFTQPLDFAVTSVNFDLPELLARGGPP
jgi:hypothetical protein